MDPDAREFQGRGEAILCGIVVAVTIAIAAFLGVHQLQPPDAVPADAPPDEFSSARAMEHLKVIAVAPRPVGSPAHAEIRAYLLQELRKLGLEPQIQKAGGAQAPSAKQKQTPELHNVVARLNGTSNSKAVALVTHYDSVARGPGAADAGAGVAAILETLRALKSSGPLRNDVIVLITDGEEIGLRGAIAFVLNHPWAKDIGLVLNFEGRGSSGQVLMFETSSPNRALIAEFAKAVPYPAATSLSYEVYRRMPNDTDFTVFRRAGCAGFNFGNIDRGDTYHTKDDNLENLDERVVQHHGSYALSLTRHFGNLDLRNMARGDSVYFNAFGFYLVHYSEKWAFVFVILMALCFAAVAFIGLRAKRLTISGVLLGLLAFSVSLAIAPLFVACLIEIVRRLHRGSDYVLLFGKYKLLLSAAACLTIAVSVAFYVSLIRGPKALRMALFAASIVAFAALSPFLIWWHVPIVALFLAFSFFLLRKGSTVWDLAFGGLTGWAVAMVAVSALIPGASFLLTWPLLFSLVSFAATFLDRQPNLLSLRTAVLFAICAFPAVLCFSGYTYLFAVAMGPNLLAIAMVWLAFLVGLLVPNIHVMAAVNRWIVPGAALLGVVCLVAAILRSQ